MTQLKQFLDRVHLHKDLFADFCSKQVELEFVVKSYTEQFETRHDFNCGSVEDDFLWRFDPLVGYEHDKGLGPVDVEAVEFAPVMQFGNLRGELDDELVDVVAGLVESGVISKHDALE